MTINYNRGLIVGRVHSILSFVFCYGILFSGNAWAGSLEEVLARMSESSLHTFLAPAQTLKEAGKTHYHKIGGYQARILRSFCSDVYGDRYNGEVPPIATSGGSGVRRGKVWKASSVKRMNLDMRIEAIASKCEKSYLVEKLLKGYWTATADHLEAYLGRVAQLINIRNGQDERIIFGDRQTVHTEKAVQENAGFADFIEAVKADTEKEEERVFGDLALIFARVKMQIQTKEKFESYFPTAESLAAAVKAFSDEVNEAERLAEDVASKR